VDRAHGASRDLGQRVARSVQSLAIPRLTAARDRRCFAAADGRDVRKNRAVRMLIVLVLAVTGRFNWLFSAAYGLRIS